MSGKANNKLHVLFVLDGSTLIWFALAFATWRLVNFPKRSSSRSTQSQRKSSRTNPVHDCYCHTCFRRQITTWPKCMTHWSLAGNPQGLEVALVESYTNSRITALSARASLSDLSTFFFLCSSHYSTSDVYTQPIPWIVPANLLLKSWGKHFVLWTAEIFWRAWWWYESKMCEILIFLRAIKKIHSDSHQYIILHTKRSHITESDKIASWFHRSFLIQKSHGTG